MSTTVSDPAAAKARRLEWFHDARYGMFIHWGAYSMAARGEWVMNRERIPLEEYTRLYVDTFTAERFDPDAWARLAKEAGMGYMVLTTRHHDGFCLWDTATSDFNAVKLGPRRDLVRAYAEAARRAGLKVGFYYSVADWHHPDYPEAFARDWPTGWTDEAKRQRFVAYYRAQLEELCTHYGKVDILWYDGCIPAPLDGDETNARIRALQPDILINERNGDNCDYRCSEQTVHAKEGAWEACLTLNGNWGWHAGDRRWKTSKDVADLLLRCAGQAGNLLINVGPRADGTIPEESMRVLQEVGAWLRRNREFLPRSERCPFTWNCTVLPTLKGNTLYLHFLNDHQGSFCYAEIHNRVLRVRDVATGREVPFRQDGPRLFLDQLPPCTDPVALTLALELDGTPTPETEQKSFWIPG